MALLIADLYEAAGASRRLGERLAATEGQTQARWQLLSVFSGPPLTVPQAARRLGVFRQGVQRLVGELERDGLLRSVPNPDHKTSSLVVLTDAGRDLLARINLRAQRVHEQQLHDFPSDRAAALRAELRSLTAAIGATPLGFEDESESAAEQFATRSTRDSAASTRRKRK
jgi:DNA-binding MarR family transcriptional regulator